MLSEFYAEFPLSPQVRKKLRELVKGIQSHGKLQKKALRKARMMGAAGASRVRQHLITYPVFYEALIAVLDTADRDVRILSKQAIGNGLMRYGACDHRVLTVAYDRIDQCSGLEKKLSGADPQFLPRETRLGKGYRVTCFRRG